MVFYHVRSLEKHIFDSCHWCLQGAAFDVPQEIADQLMTNVEELTKRGFELDMPTSLPVEEERSYGGRDRDNRFGMRPGGSGGRQGCVSSISPYITLQKTKYPAIPTTSPTCKGIMLW